MGLLTLGQAAAMIGEPRHVVRYAVRQGHLAACRQGFRLFVDSNDIERWARERADRLSYNGLIPVVPKAVEQIDIQSLE